MSYKRFLLIITSVLLFPVFTGCAVHTTQSCQLIQQRPTMSDLKDLYKKYNNVPIVLVGEAAYYCPCAERKPGAGTGSRSVGGGTESRKLGGDMEARKLGGDVEARTLGGDTEARKLGGDTEARKPGGGTGSRKTGGDIGTLSCAPHQKCGYFTLKGVRTPVQFFDGSTIRTVMPGKCVE